MRFSLRLAASLALSLSAASGTASTSRTHADDALPSLQSAQGTLAPDTNLKHQWEAAYRSARSLVDQMTLEEKVNITRGFPNAPNTCAGNSGSVPRLQWPGLCLHDAGNGVRATDMVNSYPSGVHVGASWDRRLTYDRGYSMGAEFRTKGVNVVLGPSAGPLGRVPVGGRNWEGFSVDPYLSGQLGSETVKGYQEAGVIANVKHFIANEQETLRRPYHGVEAASSNVDDKTLHEYYLWPFVDSIQAGVASVMCSYNRVNNTYACDSGQLLNDLLRDELGFKGFVLLDWNAEHRVDSANAGLDMVMPTEGAWGRNLSDAVGSGLVTEKTVTTMATRIVAAWYLTGQHISFPQPGVGMQNLTEPHDLVDARNASSIPTLLEGAVAGHVLLKNVKAALPLKKPRMVSVFGYDAALPSSKNTDTLFELGYESSPEMAQAVLGTEQHFDQAARGGVIIMGGRAAANAPGYISDPLSALQQRARQDMTWLNWDVAAFEPPVNPASDACLVFINAMSTEGWDREGLRDAASDSLVKHVASRCANTIVVIHTVGVRIVDDWIDHANITAAIVAHLPGQDSGTALVRLLYGEENFSGKLPYTIARNESDYHPLLPCGLQHGTDRDPQCNYTEGVYLDYRAFDKYNMTPRFEFGYGLSYTTFEYTSLQVKQLGDNATALACLSPTSTLAELFEPVVRVSVNITNTGVVAGAEVAQLYVSIPNSAPKQLRGFDKPFLQAGEETTVHLELTRRDLSVWDVALQKWVVQSEGDFRLLVGGSSRDIRLWETLHVGRCAPMGSSIGLEGVDVDQAVLT